MNLNQPLISVVTVCFNSEKTIERTIVSVIQQKFKELQFIIVDGKSADRTLDLIQKYAAQDARIKWVSEKDLGIYDAMNKGTLMAEGRFIHYLNSDDFLLDDQVYLKAADGLKDPQTLYYGQIKYRHRDGNTSLLGFPVGKKDLKYELKGVHQPAAFFPRTPFKELGYFNIKYRYAADYDLIRRFYKALPSEFIPLQITEMADDGASKNNFEKALSENTEIAINFGDSPLFLYAINLKLQIGKFIRYRTPGLFHWLRKWVFRKRYL